MARGVRSYDFDQAGPIGWTDGEATIRRMTVELDQEQASALERLSAGEGRPLADIVREAVAE